MLVRLEYKNTLNNKPIVSKSVKSDDLSLPILSKLWKNGFDKSEEWENEFDKVSQTKRLIYIVDSEYMESIKEESFIVHGDVNQHIKSIKRTESMRRVLGMLSNDV
jgi:hypothetical protein